MYKHILSLAALAVLVSGCGRLSAGPGGGDPHTGAVLYTRYGCLKCHAFNGQGPTIARDLTNDLSEANYSLLHYFLLVEPPKGMEYTKFLPITPKQIADLNAFENSSLTPVKAAAAPPPASSGSPSGSSSGNTGSSGGTAGADLHNGARLWVSTRCVQCHKINGVGGTAGEDLTRKPSMTYDRWLALAHNPQQPPGMDYVPSLHLTNAQVRDMSAFAFSSLKPGK